MAAVEVTPAVLAEMPLPHHADDETKGDRGTVLVVGGGRQTPGAALLAGLAALRVGAGRLQIATVESAAPSLAVAVPEARVVGVAETGAGELAADAASDVAELAGRAAAVLVGPGVLEADGVAAILGAVLDAAPGVVVVDAAALQAPALRGCGRADVLAVPNASECRHLGPDAPTAARELGFTVCCRGASTTTATPDGRMWHDAAGALGLATSGSGDVAAGAIAGLAARGAAPEVAAVWGAHLHGRCGERLTARVGRLGFLAREILDELPLALAELTGPRP